MADATRTIPSVTDVVRALRPGQWIKNVVVLAAFFFALGDKVQSATLRGDLSSFSLLIAAAFALFCVLSSGVYVVNDLMDLPFDRVHPQKRLRPIAAGRVRPGHAWLLAVLLLGGGLWGCFAVSPRFGIVGSAYVVLQAAYSFGLKRIALLDILMIAIGFVLRALAGAVVLGVDISPWLMLCTFLLALFLGFCKRRHEKILLSDFGIEHRPSLGEYDEKLLDQVISIVASATVVCYAMYTLSPETRQKFGSYELGFSIPFVVFGIFRYLDLVYRHEKGDKPERILLTDFPLVADILLYGLAVLFIFTRSPSWGM